MEPHRESRKRLRPWLERMINNGDCPGVVWENREERTFRIPWRHFNNKDWVERDSKIFMEWAKYTGKYKDGDPVEYPVWKTRLRCALKKIPEIKELPELHHLEDADPYRIYQFIDIPLMKKGSDFDSDCCASPASSASALTNSPAYGRDFLEESSSPPPNYGNYKCPTQSANVPTVVFDDDEGNGARPLTYNNLTIKEEKPDFLHQYEEQANVKNHIQHSQEGNYMEVSGFDYRNFNIPPGVDFLQTPLPSQTFVCPNMISSTSRTAISDAVSSTTAEEPATAEPDSMKASLPSDLMSLDSTDLCHMSGSMSGLHAAEFNISTGSQPGSLRNQMTYSVNSQPKVEHSMQLTLYYGFPKHYILYETIKGNGCRLFYGAAAPTLQNTFIEEQMYGPKNVQQLEMPMVEPCQDIPEEQKKFIHELLDSMERGLVLTVKNGDIYAQRLCRTRVFVTDGEKHSALLDRKDKSPTKIFDFNGSFKSAYENCRREGNGEIPKPYTYLTFGQEIRKDRHNPMSRILIHVMVTHTEAARLTGELTSSTGSFQPLLSSLDSNDKLLDRFKNMQLTNA